MKNSNPASPKPISSDVVCEITPCRDLSMATPPPAPNHIRKKSWPIVYRGAAVKKRDERRDGFLRVMRKAMEQSLGEDAEAVMTELAKRGLSRGLARQAVESVAGGRFTIFALVDALTRLARQVENAGDRTAVDVQAAALLALAA